MDDQVNVLRNLIGTSNDFDIDDNHNNSDNNNNLDLENFYLEIQPDYTDGIPYKYKTELPKELQGFISVSFLPFVNMLL